MRCFWLCALLLPLLPSLTGCSDPFGDRLLDDYLDRLARASGSERPALESPPLPAYPRRRLRHAPVPEVRGGILDLFRFPGCEVAELIAQRNSILGRHADAATLLGNGGALVVRMKACRAQRDDGDWRQRVDSLIADKEPALAALAWNASFGSEAMARWWRRSAEPLGAAPQTRAPQAARSISGLRQAQQRALAGEDPQGSGYSEPWQAMAAQPYGGGWLQAAVRAVAALEAARQILEDTDAGRLCPQQRPTPASRVLARLLAEVFAARVQPWLAGLEGGMQQLQPALEDLWQAQSLDDGHPSVAVVADFRRQVWMPQDGLLSQLRAASRAHAGAWQKLLADCGSQPGRDAG